VFIPLAAMRTIKLIAGIGCFILALGFALLALATNTWFQAIMWGPIPFASFFAFVGWLLISKRKSSMPNKSRALIALTMCPLCGFMIVIIIPNFIRAEYESAQNACVNNLRQLQAAKNEWALETGATNGILVTIEDLTPYVQLDSKGQLPKCPAGGTYIFGRVGEDVRCSIGNSDWPNSHVLSGAEDYDWWTNFKYAYATLFGLYHPQKP
jgi:hypothetical protein